MSSRSGTCNACEARLAALERQIRLLLDRSGVNNEEMQEQEMELVLDQVAETGNFALLDQFLSERIREREGRAA